jgi:ParB-like chromosome segregation protein Spo0J
MTADLRFVQPVLVRREDKTVIGGHQRLLAARRLGMKTVPVIFVGPDHPASSRAGAGGTSGGRV